MIWYSLFIPIIISFLLWVYFKKEIIWWEIFLPTAISFLFIIGSYYSFKSYTLHDNEFNTHIITEARYYEYWETWVDQTCSRQVACGTETVGTGKDQTTRTVYCTEYYDCSYCSKNSAYYEMIDSGGNKISISEFEYKTLIKKWKAKQEFHELNRSIKYRGSCGQDGDMYSIKWDGDPLTAETSSYSVAFTNILKSNHSVFNYVKIDDERAIELGLYQYPKIGRNNKQNATIGLDKIGIQDGYRINKNLEFFNGMYGYKHKVKIFTLFFKEKDINIAFLQEAYWEGGNQNEIVVCIGVDNKGKFQWVKPFSWCDNKRVLIDIREDLMSANIPDSKVFIDTYTETVSKHWKYKSFEDFNYLTFQPSFGQLVFCYISTLIISLLISWWCVNNEFKE